MGLPGKAAESLTESLDINRRIGSKKEVLYNLENLISLRIAAGQLAAARELLDESLALSDSLKLTSHEATFYLYAPLSPNVRAVLPTQPRPSHASTSSLTPR